MKPHTRRSFIKTTATGGVTILAGGILPGMQASSYRRILGANDRINAAIMGVNSRGTALATNFARQADCTLTHICDVDSRAITACTAEVIKRQDSTPKGEGDFRRVLEKSGRRCHDHRGPGSLACSCCIACHAGWKECLRRETVQSQSGRRRNAGKGSFDVQEGGPDG